MPKFKKGHKGYWAGKKKPHSEETKRKIGKANTGKKHSEETKRKIGLKSKGRTYMVGVKKSEETKKRISDTLKRKGIEPKEKFVAHGKNHPRYKNGKPRCIDCGKLLADYNSKRCQKCYHLWYTGSNTYNWEGGIRTEHQKIRGSIEYRLWRESVFARDNWTCQKYGTKGGKLQAHHIHNFADYPELRTAIDNGITFSEKAHKEFHKKYGKKNNTKEQLEEFLKEENEK